MINELQVSTLTKISEMLAPPLEEEVSVSNPDESGLDQSGEWYDTKTLTVAEAEKLCLKESKPQFKVCALCDKYRLCIVPQELRTRGQFSL